MSNDEVWQLQLNEVIALSSICAPGTFALLDTDNENLPPLESRERDHGPLEVEIRVHLDLPGGSTDLQYREKSRTLKTLPPLCVTISLDPASGYPVVYTPTSIPTIHLDGSPYLTSTDEDMVLAALRSQVWEAQGGPFVPILWSMIEWLQENTLQHTTMTKGPPLVVTVQDEAAWSFLTKYDVAQDAKRFQQTIQTCPVCLEDRPGTQLVRLPGCRHAMCRRPCLLMLVTTGIRTGDLGSLCCPESDCRLPLAPHMIQQVLLSTSAVSPEMHNLLERWEKITLSRALDAMQDLEYCPRCNTPCLAHGGGGEEGNSLAQCTQCLFAFCTRCRASYHPRSQPCTADMNTEEYRNEQLTKQLLESQGVQQCPNCAMAIIKSGGCNKMVCPTCGTSFCWLCRTKLKKEKAYEHFNPFLGVVSCAGKLFDMEEIERFNMEQEGLGWEGNVEDDVEGQRRQQQRPRPRPQHAAAVYKPCVTCGQRIEKVAGNNHLRCMWCNTSFCFLCDAVLRGKGAAGRHYGPRHRQHS